MSGENQRAYDRYIESGVRQEVAYIHPQGIVPDGLFFDGRMVSHLLLEGVIAYCDDCGSEDPNDPAFAIVGDDVEEMLNLGYVERYEVRS